MQNFFILILFNLLFSNNYSIFKEIEYNNNIEGSIYYQDVINVDNLFIQGSIQPFYVKNDRFKRQNSFTYENQENMNKKVNYYFQKNDYVTNEFEFQNGYNVIGNINSENLDNTKVKVISYDNNLNSYIDHFDRGKKMKMIKNDIDIFTLKFKKDTLYAFEYKINSVEDFLNIEFYNSYGKLVHKYNFNDNVNVNNSFGKEPMNIYNYIDFKKVSTFFYAKDEEYYVKLKSPKKCEDIKKEYFQKHIKNEELINLSKIKERFVKERKSKFKEDLKKMVIDYYSERKKTDLEEKDFLNFEYTENFKKYKKEFKEETETEIKNISTEEIKLINEIKNIDLKIEESKKECKDRYRKTPTFDYILSFFQIIDDTEYYVLNNRKNKIITENLRDVKSIINHSKKDWLSTDVNDEIARDMKILIRKHIKEQKKRISSKPKKSTIPDFKMASSAINKLISKRFLTEKTTSFKMTYLHNFWTVKKYKYGLFLIRNETKNFNYVYDFKNKIILESF